MSHQVANIHHCMTAVILIKQMPTSDKPGSATFFPCFHFNLLIFIIFHVQSICRDVREACILWNIYMLSQKKFCFACIMFSSYAPLPIDKRTSPFNFRLLLWGCPEMSVRNYHYSLNNSLGECSSQNQPTRMQSLQTPSISWIVWSTPSKVLLEKLTVTQLVKKLSAFYES